jgi:hypothetical protein
VPQGQNCEKCDGCIDANLQLSVPNSVEVNESYLISLNISGSNIPEIINVIFSMRRDGISTTYHMLEGGNLHRPSGHTHTITRTSMNPGIWELRALVLFRNPNDPGSVIQRETTQIVRELFPHRNKFLPLFESQAKALWNKSANFAEDNKNSRSVMEFGHFIYLNPGGSYSLGEEIPGPIVQLTGAGVAGSVLFDEGILVDPDNPTRQIPIAVGTIHSHYPITWAVPSYERDVGASGPDNSSIWPGIVYDYTYTVSSGQGPNIPGNPRTIYTHPLDLVRRVNWCEQIVE